jgi:hypothetical protein
LLTAAELRAAARGVEIELAQLLIHLDRRDAERLHARRIELDADLAVDAATALHLRNACDRQQPLGDRAVDEPAQFLLGQRGRARREVGDGPALDVDPLDQRLVNALGQLAAHLRNRVANVRDGAIDRRADLEFDEH